MTRWAGAAPAPGTLAMLVATFCIENGHRLLHAGEFDALEPLGLETV